MLDRLQPHLLPVCPVDHVEVHVELGGDDRGDEALEEVGERLLERPGAREEVEVQVRHRNAHLAVVEVLENLRVHVAEDLGAISDEELAAALGRRAEAHERSIRGGLLEGALIVEANVVLAQRLLVHLLVHSVLGGEEGAEARGVDGVEARRQPQHLPHATEALRVLGHVKVSEDHGTVGLEVRHQFLSVLLEVSQTLGVRLVVSNHFKE
mmetsp:Transcript_25278/g.51450  ORF Transcript_25278/g.51450 Transcript_25278/m.51450 type:complete len:210 (+) Transcript_25278:465-1094(+)